MAASPSLSKVLSVAELGLEGQVGQVGQRAKSSCRLRRSRLARVARSTSNEGDGAQKVVAFLESIKVL